MAIEIGDVINERYTVTGFMKQGRLTEFWFVQDIILKRMVVARVVQEDALENARYIARFAQDARILAQLEHPHIVPIYDYGIHKKRPYQIQRLIGSGTLEDFLNPQPSNISTQDTLELLQQIASAVDYIHTRGIVHRNLRAHDVILDNQNLPYVSNFGLALVEDDSDLSLDEFIAPTQETLHIDKGGDTYDFALLVYRCFTYSEEHEVFRNDIRQHRPDLPLGLDIILNRLTHEDEDYQYAKLRDAVDDLYQAFYSGQGAIDGQIFISYARKDSEYVHNLAKELRQLGLDVWIDQDIEPGANWDDAIQNALDDCDMMLLIATEFSMFSEYVTHEWSYFMGAGKPVYPFIPQIPIPKNIHPRLSRVQHVVGTDDTLSNVAQIIDILAGGNPRKTASETS